MKEIQAIPRRLNYMLVRAGKDTENYCYFTVSPHETIDVNHSAHMVLFLNNSLF